MWWPLVRPLQALVQVRRSPGSRLPPAACRLPPAACRLPPASPLAVLRCNALPSCSSVHCADSYCSLYCATLHLLVKWHCSL